MREITPRAQLRIDGWSTNKITAAVRGQKLHRAAPGLYVLPDGIDEYAFYRIRVRATMQRRGGVASHVSAAALHGIPYHNPDRTHVHITLDRASGGGRRGKVHLHARPLPPEDVTEVDGALATSRARTAIDAAMTGDLVRGVCAIDAVRLVRRYPRPEDPDPVSVEELQACIDRMGSRRGAGVVRRALALSVDRSESAGESWSRMQMHASGLPMPELQVEYHFGESVYFADFTWPGLVGEFDGRGKYGDDVGEEAEVLEREKSRQETFETAGFEVLRWSWRVLNHDGALASMLRPALDRHVGPASASA
ncbi:hypothetical protein [Tsukamurella sp. PLM1]|uniref:type IV toxin-antitoxin system AbiEi family antitoxin domain-containing protein n=1 Tax=Tsukamurella sp. PLM1 TaxID=2929795 RepID=UPI0020BE0473|nr:hypothetical protein [Tsukamurella sp. PLM1]